MQILQTGLNLEAFFARVRAASTRVLMLDYDGTLAPFRVDPAKAVPYPGVVSLLDAIMATGRTRLLIVSGRWTRNLIPLLGLRSVPEIWGSHGWERLHPDGGYEAAPIDPPVRARLLQMEEWVGQVEPLGGRCERKPSGMAIHWRGLDNARRSEIRNVVFQKWMETGYAEDLDWHDFDGGIELRAPGRDKGDVVRTVAAEAGTHPVFAYLGDDLTDESAFEAMPAGGLSVLVRSEFRRTRADLWLHPPGELLEFLDRWHTAAGHD